jgi:hypothetical protein
MTEQKCPQCGEDLRYVSRYGKEAAVSWVRTLRIERPRGPSTGGEVVGTRRGSLLCMVDGQAELVLHEKVCKRRPGSN